LCERLLPVGKERIAWAKMAAVLVTARLCEPSSELHIAEDWYRRTALADLLQLADEEVNKDRLYRALDHLLVRKHALEAHLSRRCGELFAGPATSRISSRLLCRARTDTRRTFDHCRTPQGGEVMVRTRRMHRCCRWSVLPR
jgi:hypothetical protein